MYVCMYTIVIGFTLATFSLMNEQNNIFRLCMYKNIMHSSVFYPSFLFLISSSFLKFCMKRGSFRLVDPVIGLAKSIALQYNIFLRKSRPF